MGFALRAWGSGFLCTMLTLEFEISRAGKADPHLALQGPGAEALPRP